MRAGRPIGTPNRSKIDTKVHQASPKATFGGKVNAISPMVEKFDAKQTVALRDPGPAPPKPLPNLAALAVVTSSLAFGSFRDMYIKTSSIRHEMVDVRAGAGILGR